MTTSQQNDDPRWDNRVPWYLRHSGATVSGSLDVWLERIGQRLERLFVFNECGLLNEGHFGASLETETLGRFSCAWGMPLGAQLKAYFLPAEIYRQAQFALVTDREEQLAAGLEREQRRAKTGATAPMTPERSTEVLRTLAEANNTRAARTEAHRSAAINDRISTLEATMLLLSRNASPVTGGGLGSFVADVRRICAATQVPLDVRGPPPLIYPLEEPLLQREVIEPLLTRLAARWPDRARELVTAYHDVIVGKPLDEVFSSAFKSVEEIARALTGDPNFDFSERDLDRHFPSLHPTIKAGILKLRAHRGDEAAHGRKAPDQSEIRFLLFQLCNLALLLLDTQPR